MQGVLEGADSGAVAGAAVRQRRHAGRDRRDQPRRQRRGRRRLARCASRKITPIDLLLFSRQMYTLLKAGVPILRALAGLQESSINPAFKDVLQERAREPGERARAVGVACSARAACSRRSTSPWCDVGETTGRLEEIFLRLFHHLEFEKYMRDQVKSALRYPIFVIVVMAVAHRRSSTCS